MGIAMAGIDVFWLNRSHFFKRFSSWFFIAAILPIVVFAATNREAYTLNSQAAQNPTIRIWIEPSRLITSVGKPAKLKVYANFENDKKLIHGLTVSLLGGSDLRIAPATLSTPNPFQGRVALGEFSVTPQNTGTFEIALTADAKDAQGQLVQIETQPSTIITK